MYELQTEQYPCKDYTPVLLSRLEGCDRCRCDYVEIYDGPLHTGSPLGRICYGSYHTFTSSSNMMTIKFHTDSSVTRRGFLANYYSISADQNTSIKLPLIFHLLTF